MFFLIGIVRYAVWDDFILKKIMFAYKYSNVCSGEKYPA